MAEKKQTNLIIAGIGNLLLRDDGVGVHAVHALQQDPIPGVEAVEVGTAILRALPLLEQASGIIIVDAMKAGSEPGTIYTCPYKALAAQGDLVSIHQMSVREGFSLLPGAKPPDMFIIGVEPESIDEYSMELSPTVQAALPDVVALARSVALQWIEQGIMPSPLPASK